MTHADQIRLHLTRLSDAINAGRHVAAHDALSEPMGARQ